MLRAAVLAVAAAVILLAAAAAQRGAAQTPAYPDTWAAGYGMACTGAAGECAVARRELGGGGGYIGYGAMRRDQTPCSIRGAPYGNCNPGAVANPYNRGCQAIARCRG
ncbi:hypothetical protein ACP70R_036136 [Stipagrostis hirtigluma subsp. patula]